MTLNDTTSWLDRFVNVIYNKVVKFVHIKVRVGIILKKVIIAIIMFLFVACGDVNEETELGEVTLSIHAPQVYHAVINRAALNMTNSLAERGTYINFEITIYEPAETDEQNARLQTMLMARQPYDLIFWNFNPINTWADNGFLSDIYTLIDSDSNTDLDDFFTNVLSAYEHNGGLYSFPVSFGFEYMGINANLPSSILNHFVARDSITLYEMMVIYNDLKANYDNYSHLSFSNSLTLGSPFNMAAVLVSEFIDFENNTANLNNAEFVSKLNHFYKINSGRGIFDLSGQLVTSPTNEIMQTADTVFFGFNNHLMPILSLVELEQQYFTNFIPLANDNGELLINPIFMPHGIGGSTWARLLIPVSGNEKFAWEFVQHLIPAMISHYQPTLGTHDFLAFGLSSLVTPITRVDFVPHVTNVMQKEMVTNPIFRSNEFSYVIDDAISSIAYLNSKSVAILNYYTLPYGILTDVFNSFLLGTNSVEETAQELQNRMSLWLLE